MHSGAWRVCMGRWGGPLTEAMVVDIWVKIATDCCLSCSWARAGQGVGTKSNLTGSRAQTRAWGCHNQRPKAQRACDSPSSLDGDKGSDLKSFGLFQPFGESGRTQYRIFQGAKTFKPPSFLLLPACPRCTGVSTLGGQWHWQLLCPCRIPGDLPLP